MFGSSKSMVRELSRSASSRRGSRKNLAAPSKATKTIAGDDASKMLQVRKQFLLLVKSSYTNMLEDGVMPPRSTLAIDVNM